MELVWKHFLQVIGQLSRSCQKLIELARNQREAIVHEQIQTLGQLVIEQEQETANFQTWEAERQALLQEIGAQVGEAPEQLTMTRLMSRVPEAWGNEYRIQSKTLKEQMETVKRENDINRKLLQQNQRFISWLLNYLVTPEGSAPLYDNVGVQSQRSYYHVINQMM